jgi:hypothetical protein
MDSGFPRPIGRGRPDGEAKQDITTKPRARSAGASLNGHQTPHGGLPKIKNISGKTENYRNSSPQIDKTGTSSQYLIGGGDPIADIQSENKSGVPGGNVERKTVSRKTNSPQGKKSAASNPSLKKAVARRRKKEFPGARKMQLPFKEAVEKYVVQKYNGRIGKGLTKADIFRDDKKLYIAFDNYEKQFGHSPFNIPSVRDLARERFERVVNAGLDNVSRRDRDAAHKMARRIDRKLAPG